MTRRTPLEERLWSKTDKTETCWIWTGYLDRKGYGEISKGGRHGRMQRTHRVAYELASGPIPAGLEVDHSCRRRDCVNPAHLRLATRKQNMENKGQEGASNNKSSGVRGVYRASNSSWFGRVSHDKQVYHVGTFATIEEAKAAVIAKRNELFTHNDADRMS